MIFQGKHDGLAYSGKVILIVKGIKPESKAKVNE
jgi:hypothetical protein